ncbi:MAG TPA: cupin domain-containing protein [Sandaracinaceae bacterium LLY-WYZ-13_1]|nr:cupin domain-containing protein [Sandaracinaceae bacterium LLY-WYZ-13_1]
MRALTTALALALAGCASCPACPADDPDAWTAGGEAEGVCPEETEAPPEEAGAPVEAEVRALADAPRREAPPGTASVAMLARGTNAFVARLEMAPGAEVPEHQDADEEYIHVLEGRGTMWIDGVEHEVGPGATIFMPAGATVRFRNGDAPLVALQIFAGPGSAAKYERWNPVAAEGSEDPAEGADEGTTDPD